MNRRVWLPALLALTAAIMFGQDAVRTGWFSVSTGEHALLGRPIAGAPYSADEVTENVQTLADGTHITHTSTVKVYRDAEGRTRTERPMGPPGMENADAPVMTEILDPVAHVHYVLNAADKTARKHSFGPPEGRADLKEGARPFFTATKPASHPMLKPHENPEPPETSVEKLGSQTIEGLSVEGTRRTTTWPVGSMMGNDRPITSVTETWMSPELKIVVLSKRTDPQSGEHTTRLVNLSRAEPDPSLFQPPADYTVIEEDRPAPR